MLLYLPASAFWGSLLAVSCSVTEFFASVRRGRLLADVSSKGTLRKRNRTCKTLSESWKTIGEAAQDPGIG